MKIIKFLIVIFISINQANSQNMPINITIDEAEQIANSFLAKDLGENYFKNYVQLRNKKGFDVNKRLTVNRWKTNYYSFNFDVIIKNWDERNRKNITINVNSREGKVINYKECVFCVDIQNFVYEKNIDSILLQKGYDLKKCWKTLTLSKKPYVECDCSTKSDGNIDYSDLIKIDLYSGKILSVSEVGSEDI